MPRCLVTAAVLVTVFLPVCALAETGPSNGEGARRNVVPRCQGAPRCLPTFIARMKNAPFPIDKNDDGRGRKFFTEKDSDTGARVRVARNGERYPEPDHYADPSVLFHIPPHFKRDKPFRLVVHFHSHETVLDPGIVDSGLLEQIDESGANVILIVPQLAYRAVDSHPGKLMRPGGLRRMMNEATGVLARTLGEDMRSRLAAAPIVLSAFSGGDVGLAAGLRVRPTVRADRAFESRIEGIVLIDAVFERFGQIDAWLKARGQQVFVVSLYGRASIRWTRRLIRRLRRRDVPILRSLPRRIGRGTIAFLRVETDHAAMFVEGPPKDPIANILGRLPLP
jgi:hypothetical protein